MEQDGVIPGVVAATALILSCCKAYRWDEATKVSRQAQEHAIDLRSIKDTIVEISRKRARDADTEETLRIASTLDACGIGSEA